MSTKPDRPNIWKPKGGRPAGIPEKIMGENSTNRQIRLYNRLDMNMDMNVNEQNVVINSKLSRLFISSLTRSLSLYQQKQIKKSQKQQVKWFSYATWEMNHMYLGAQVHRPH